VPWSALALVGSFELLMLLIRKHHRANAEYVGDVVATGMASELVQSAPDPAKKTTPSLEQVVRGLHQAGRSQRSIAKDLKLDRRKVKRYLDQTAG
jgi:DNA-binding NarL/FixJ family response regulator